MPSFYEIIQNRTLYDRTGQPIDSCNTCAVKLEEKVVYIIAKAYMRGKAIMETAQCINCQMDAHGYASEQSLENIMLYSGRRFSDYIRKPESRESYHLEEPSCLITGEILEPNDSFEIYHFNLPDAGLNDQDYLFVGPTAMEQMTELLSRETRKSWGRYLEEITPDSPEKVISPIFMT